MSQANAHHRLQRRYARDRKIMKAIARNANVELPYSEGLPLIMGFHRVQGWAMRARGNRWRSSRPWSSQPFWCTVGAYRGMVKCYRKPPEGAPHYMTRDGWQPMDDQRRISDPAPTPAPNSSAFFSHDPARDGFNFSRAEI